MKWGKRKARGHAGSGVYITRKRQLAGDKRDLTELNEGKHLSVGLTKKRQAAYDARDKAALEKRIAKNQAKAKKNRRMMNNYGEIYAETSNAFIKRAAGTALASIGVMTIGTVAGTYAKRQGKEAAYNAIKRISRAALAGTVATGTGLYIRDAYRIQNGI
jgi:hypothetical protein